MQTSTFLSFSSELMGAVLEYVSPLDIISFRQVSQTCFAVSNDRFLWESRIQRLADETDIFLPQFDFPNMTLRDLEEAATSPERLIRSVQRSDSDYLPPTFKKKLSPESLDLIEKVILIPGGRYLLTQSKSIMRLWDLGIGPASEPNSNDLASVIFASNPRRWINAIIPFGNTKSSVIHVLVNLYGGSGLYGTPYNDGNWCNVYSIDLCAPSPRFELLASRRWNCIGEDMFLNCALLKRAPNYNPGEYILWDFAGDRYAKFVIGISREEYSPGVYLRNVVLREDSFFGLYRSESVFQIGVFALPEFQTIDAQKIYPLRSQRLDLNGGPFVKIFPPPFFRNEKAFQLEILARSAGGAMSEIVCYDILGMTKDTPDGLKRVHSYRTSYSQTPSQYELLERKGNVSQVLCIFRGELVTEMAFPERSKIETSAAKARLTTTDDIGLYFETKSFSFCSYSGRAIIIERPGKIWVYDYLLPANRVK